MRRMRAAHSGTRHWTTRRRCRACPAPAGRPGTSCASGTGCRTKTAPVPGTRRRRRAGNSRGRRVSPLKRAGNLLDNGFFWLKILFFRSKNLFFGKGFAKNAQKTDKNGYFRPVSRIFYTGGGRNHNFSQMFDSTGNSNHSHSRTRSVRDPEAGPAHFRAPAH